MFDVLRGRQIRRAAAHTGTFFCEITTAQFFPRIPREVMLAEVIALNAYSIMQKHRCQRRNSDNGGVEMWGERMSLAYACHHIHQKCNPRTNLVKTTLVGENGDVSIVRCLDEAMVSFLIMKSWGIGLSLSDNKVEGHTGHDGGNLTKPTQHKKAAECNQADKSTEELPRCTPTKWTRRSAWFS